MIYESDVSRLLIVEDNPEQAKRAVTLGDSHFRKYDTTVVDNAEHALISIRRGTEYVLSDLFFPAGKHTQRYIEKLTPTYNTFMARTFSGKASFDRYKRFKAGMEQALSNGLLPSGIFVANYAQERNIPCVIVTAAQEDSDELQVIRDLITVPVITGYGSGTKLWELGFEQLGRMYKK